MLARFALMAKQCSLMVGAALRSTKIAVTRSSDGFSFGNVRSYGSVLYALALGRTSVRLLLPLFVLYITIAHGFSGLAPVQAVTGINEQLNFQARLLDDSGALVPDGYYNVRFKIYCGGDGDLVGAGTGSDCNHAENEKLLWTETHDYNGGSPDQRVRVANGYLTAQLNSINSDFSTVDWNEDKLWVTVDIGGSTTTASWDGEMEPFMRLTAVPYAFNADNLDGLDSTNFVQLAQGEQAINTASTLISIDQAGAGNLIDLQVSDNSRLLLTNAGNLTVSGTGSFEGATLSVGKASTTTGTVRFYDSNSAYYVALQSPDMTATGAARTFILPDDYGGVGECLQDTTGTGVLGFGSCGGVLSLQNAYDGGNSITTASSTDIDFVLASGNFDIDIADNTANTVSISRADGAGTTDPAQLLLIENLDTNRIINDGILIQSAAGGITDAIDVSDTELVNALNVGANTIVGTTAVIDFTNVDFNGDGSFTLQNNSTSDSVINLASSGDFVINDNGTPVLTLADNGDFTYVSSTNGTSAFEIQSASSADTLFSADTSNNRLIVGNSTGTNTATTLLVLDSATTDPTTNTVNGAMYYDSNLNKFRCYEGGSWTNCIFGGGGDTITQKFIPEFNGGTLSADGSNNIGAMTADFVNGLSSGEGEKHNYYSWSTAQSTAQDYDIVVNIQLPSNFSSMGGASTLKFWHEDPDGSATNAQTTWSMYDVDETQCFSSTFNGTTSSVWEQEAASSLGSCSFAANDIVTFIFHLSTTSSAGAINLGEFEFQYSN